jgi:hypothetical protein
VGIIIVTLVIGLGIWGNTEAMSGFQLVLSLGFAFFLSLLGWSLIRVGMDKQEETLETREYFALKTQKDRGNVRVQCGKCSHVNAAGAKFCEECGNALT